MNSSNFRNVDLLLPKGGWYFVFCLQRQSANHEFSNKRALNFNEK